jgi:hypothetical protein
LALGLIVLWWKEIGAALKKVSVLAMALVMALTAVGCGPYQKEVAVTIEPNETAFLIPLEGASQSGQGKFMSVEYLEQAKVATKRITVPTRQQKLGWETWNYQWIPTMIVIKVNRSPVTREWTKTANTGTSPKDQAIVVESVESIDFYLGVNATALIQEEDAAKFLYYFSGKSLEDVMDTVIRGYVQSYLYREYGSRTLEECRADKKKIFAAMQEEAKATFKAKGITIENIGGSEGYTYKDPKIQEAINSVFAAQQQVLVAKSEKDAQDMRNQKDLEIANNGAKIKKVEADAYAQATLVRGKADADVLEMRGAMIARYPSLVSMTIAERSTGQVPATLYVTGDGSNLPFVVTLPQATPPVTPTAATR